jgi:uncharacterized protein (DUF433 family)
LPLRHPTQLITASDSAAKQLNGEQILADYPDLEAEDLQAALRYAAREIDHPVLVA